MPMSPKQNEQMVGLIRSALEAHNAWWDKQRTVLRLHRNLYASKFHEGSNAAGVKVETGDGPTHVESYLGALFSRAPAVEVGEDPLRADVLPEIPARIANTWLPLQRKVMEQAVRIAIIYPQGFIRVGPKHTTLALDPVDAVEAQAVSPWDVMLDTSAIDWDHMRWAGHRYTVSVAAARKRFPGARFKGGETKDFFTATARKKRGENVPDEMQQVTIIEFYDLVRHEVLFWSADVDGGERILAHGPMPLHRPGTQIPMLPIVPLYMQYIPDAPLFGISVLSRNYDQFREKNLLRTNAANNIRRDNRQYEVKKGVYDEDALARLQAGVDGNIIETEGTPGQNIKSIDVGPMSSNFDQYARDIENDIAKGAVLAPFTRGEASKATATEIGVLAEYSASAIGRMARERDFAIEEMAALFLAHLVPSSAPVALLRLGAPGPDGLAPVVTVSGAMLDRKWRISALDQAGTPMSRALAQQRFTGLIPLLTPLGVPPRAILNEMLRLELISPALAAAIPPEAPPAPAAGAPATGAVSEAELLALAADGQRGAAV